MEYIYNPNTPLAAFCYVSDFFKKNKERFKDEGEYRYYVTSDMPIRSLYTHPRFTEEEISRAIEEANHLIGGKSFVPIVK